VATLKKLFLDTVATSLAGTTLGAGCVEVEKVVRAAAGTPESTVIGFGLQAPALTAAFANGATAHALNYDALGGDGGHLGVTTLPAPLAAAERRGGVSGTELLAAMGSAAEVTARLAGALSRVGINPNRKFLEGQVLGYFGAAVGAGRVMGLSAAHMHSALGVAMMQAGGTMQVVLEGDPPAKAIYGGFANLGGMLAALLSEQGLGAHIQAIEGDAGLYGLFYDGQYAQDVIESGLGHTYLLHRARFKPWPTSGVVHPFIEAACLLAQRHRLSHTDIVHVLVRGDDHMRQWCEPLAERRTPPNPASAANSVLFGTAKALVYGKVGLGDFTPEGLQDPLALSVASRTNYEIHAAMHGAATVQVNLRDGQQVSETVHTPLGHPDRPLTFDQIVAKLRDCAPYAAAPLSTAAVDRLIEGVERLEDVADVATLSALIIGRPAR
jgi:2-methylcitrate dehydratase PrpD